MFPIQIVQYCDNLSKVVGATLFNADYPILWLLKKVFGKPIKPPSSFLKRCDGKLWRIDYRFCFPSCHSQEIITNVINI